MRRRGVLAAAASLAAAAAPAAPPAGLPNLVILLVESTDGRLFWDDSPAPLPNIRALSRTGVRFDNTYSQAPVCCPSRGTLLTGRHVHRIPHWHNSQLVAGLWNNYEGLNANQSTLWDALAAAGYGDAIHLTGKQDWQDGGHSEDNEMQAWTHNVPFAYNISADGGWDTELGVCASQGTVAAGGSGGPKGSVYPGDWSALANNTAWIAQAAATGKPWIAYQVRVGSRGLVLGFGLGE
jgi:arylsulfatase A-like enzyme